MLQEKGWGLMSVFKKILASARSSPTARSALKRAVQMAHDVKHSIKNLETTAVNDVLEKAKSGDAEAQNDCGEMYYLGSSVPQDDGEAAAWFQKAAEQNHPKAQASLAAMAALGRGLERDDCEAYKWARLAVSQGHPNAAKTLEHLKTRMSPEEIAVGENRAAEQSQSAKAISVTAART